MVHLKEAADQITRLSGAGAGVDALAMKPEGTSGGAKYARLR
jgi:hypothetical protein